MKPATMDDLNTIRAKHPEVSDKERANRDAPGVIGNSDAAILAQTEDGEEIDCSPMLRGHPAKLPMKIYIGENYEKVVAPDVMAILNDMLGSMFPKEYRKFWEDKAKTAADLAGPGITDEERLKRGLALKRERLSLELQEERILTELRSQGIDVDRRADLDPRAVIFDQITIAEKMPEPKKLWQYA